jgi:hypothetical protein
MTTPHSLAFGTLSERISEEKASRSSNERSAFQLTADEAQSGCSFVNSLAQQSNFKQPTGLH